MRAVGFETMPHNDHGDDVDVDAKGRRDRRNDAQGAIGLIFGLLAVVVGHDCCGSLTFSRATTSNFDYFWEKVRRRIDNGDYSNRECDEDI